MPEADLFSFRLAQEGHSRAVLSVLYTREYRFLTVEPNLALSPCTASIFLGISLKLSTLGRAESGDHRIACRVEDVSVHVEDVDVYKYRVDRLRRDKDELCQVDHLGLSHPPVHDTGELYRILVWRTGLRIRGREGEYLGVHHKDSLVGGVCEGRPSRHLHSRDYLGVAETHLRGAVRLLDQPRLDLQRPRFVLAPAVDSLTLREKLDHLCLPESLHHVILLDRRHYSSSSIAVSEGEAPKYFSSRAFLCISYAVFCLKKKKLSW